MACECQHVNAAVHTGTPSLIGTDARGLAVRQVVYLRSKAGGDVASLNTRHVYNRAGHLIEQWDPRLPGPNLCNVYRLSGEAIRINSVDAGRRLILTGLDGEELQRWDPRGHHWRTRYDNQCARWPLMKTLS